MKALVTGASSGIGRDISIYLSSLGYDLIVVARRKEKLEEISKLCKTNVRLIEMDLSKSDNVIKLYEMTKKENIDILVNNAGFGVFGEFQNTSLERELEMIETNIKAVHILMKLFFIDMKKRNSGYILNVSSSASFSSGPLMATYYSTKAYVTRLTTSLYEELSKTGSRVSVSVLCPGPVRTEFNDVANVKFALNSLPSEYVAKYAVDKLLKGKLVIVPGVMMKFSRILSKILPDALVRKYVYKIQKKKGTS